MTIPKSSRACRAEQPHEMAQKVAKGSSMLKPLEQCTPQEARLIREEKGNPFAPPPSDLDSITDNIAPLQNGNMLIRVYRPKTKDTGNLPCLVYYHGGGFVLSNVEQYDTIAQQLAFHSGCVVCSVDYTLAPERKIKGIHEDGFEAYQWIVENADHLGIDSSRIAVGGDSAGGNLSVAVLLACKQEGFPMPDFALLIYPAVDFSMSFASIDEFAEGYFLTKANMEWFCSHYLESQAQAKDPSLDFLNRDLTGLPATYLMTAGFDPLRDEGEEFAKRLSAAGVEVEHECYTDMIHGFISFAGGIPAGMESLESMGAKLKKVLNP